MKTSLDNALKEINGALTLAEKVKDPAAYKSVTDDYYLHPKHRINGLPRDGARQFFMSHHSRLANHDKSRSSDIDKQIIWARKANLNKAKTVYVELQKKALPDATSQPVTENANSLDRN